MTHNPSDFRSVKTKVFHKLEKKRKKNFAASGNRTQAYPVKQWYVTTRPAETYHSVTNSES